jgi:hypothetical protein
MSADYTALLQVTDSVVFEALPPKDQDWIRSTSQNRAELLLPFAKWIGEQWLQGFFANAKYCPTNAYAYINLSRGNAYWTMDTPEKITEAARWFGFEENALWHRRSVRQVECIFTAGLTSKGLGCLCETTITMMLLFRTFKRLSSSILPCG